ncbi:MAG TPA: hypothetical protein VFR31_00250 [Thermoanaerobaculia bacterium]|nr:hypothetical protein [Thermoanaerobaculia bacterium]
MNRSTKLCIVLLVCLAAAAHATPLQISLDIQGQGLSVAEGGVGTQGIGSGSRSFTVDIGGPVQAAFLYWAGRDRPCPQIAGACVVPVQPYKDQVIRLDGILITGAIIGTEGQPVSGGGPINNIGYLADVTAQVQAKGTGLQTFTVRDGNTASNLFRWNGVGLVVIYTDPTDSAMWRVITYHGLDFAYGADPTPGPTRVTDPVTFNHGADPGPRQGRLRLFSGDSVPGRPDRIDISNNPSLFNTLDSSDGSAWDSDVLVFDIPGGVSSTTVQLFSAPANQNPDSLLWMLGVVRLPLPEQGPVEENAGCTPGYWKNHTDSWADTGYSPGQTTGSVFSGASAFPSLAAQSLLTSLQGGGGSGAIGGARILLRAAVAALLNAAHSGVDYPRTTAEILTDVNAALGSNNRNTMIVLAAELDSDNNLGCPLN